MAIDRRQAICEYYGPGGRVKQRVYYAKWRCYATASEWWLGGRQQG